MIKYEVQMQKNEIVLAGSRYNDIKSKIFTIRTKQVMLDRDLAELYGVEKRALNQAVKRNIGRFPDRFMFQLTDTEVKNLNLKSQIVISSWGGARFQPYAFTEQGVSMLSAVLKSKQAVHISIQIMDAFVEMRKFMLSNAQIFQRLDNVELKLLKTGEKLEKVFDAMSENQIIDKQGIFFEGQMFDAYAFVSDLIRKTKKSIVIVDNYVDDRVFKLLTKRKK
jgi:phage regulator Rha-like protein